MVNMKWGPWSDLHRRLRVYEIRPIAAEARGFEILRLSISDWGWPGTSLLLHQTVVPDGFCRTTPFGFLCQRLLFWRDGLVIDNCHADFLIASEGARRGAATHVAVDAG